MNCFRSILYLPWQPFLEVTQAPFSGKGIRNQFVWQIRSGQHAYVERSILKRCQFTALSNRVNRILLKKKKQQVLYFYKQICSKVYIERVKDT